MIEGPRVEGGESTRKGNEEGRRREEAAGHTSKIPKGTCSVQGLSWGSVGPATIKQAKEQWCPQVWVVMVAQKQYRRGVQVF